MRPPTGAHRGPASGSLSSIISTKLPNKDPCPLIMREMLVVALIVCMDTCGSAGSRVILPSGNTT